ncbi:MAG: RidA family protein [Defluviitaleaceae bacterium]|nr:RidA family protein [Defluviitaleaceae bacterium]
MSKKAVATAGAPAAIGPYSQGIVAGGMVYISGQLPIDMATGDMVTDVKAGVKACLDNALAIAEAAGANKNSFVKMTMFLTDMNDFAAANEAYAAFFDGTTPPARSAFQVCKLPKGAVVEIEAIAAI